MSIKHKKELRKALYNHPDGCELNSLARNDVKGFLSFGPGVSGD
jgi:hypothetical protein